MALDLASLASVRSFAAQLKDRLKAGGLPLLHGLVCNAAVQGARTFTADGFESTFGVRHLGHYLLVNLLVPLMEKPARIAVVARGGPGGPGARVEYANGSRQGRPWTRRGER